MTGRQSLVLVLLCAVMCLTVAGCQEKLTKQRFDTIIKGVSTKLDVEQTLGEPERKLDDLWSYEKHDKHLFVKIYFDQQGKVTNKEWISGKEGLWEGAAPGIEDEPTGADRSSSERRSTTTVD